MGGASRAKKLSNVSMQNILKMTLGISQQKTQKSSSIFRANALAQVDALDAVNFSLRIITPSVWVWVLITGLFLLGFFLWGIFGSISISIPGTGILLPEKGQALPVIALQPGHISAVYAREGAYVKQHALLAEISNPYLDEDAAYLQKVVADHQKLLQQVKSHSLQKKIVLEAHFHEKMKILQVSLKDHQEKLETLQDLLTKKQILFKRRFLTTPEMTDAKEAVIVAKKELAQVKSELSLAPIQFKEAKAAEDEKVNQHLIQLLESQHALDKKMLEKKNGTSILSPGEGVVTASHITQGDYILDGKTLFTLITGHHAQPLEALVFIRHLDGKKIKTGMKAYVLPSNLSDYEYGYIQGKVIEISQYPQSRESVYPYLGNMTLVEEFFKEGVPFLAKIQLEQKAGNASGLFWTTHKGAPFKIKPGSTVSVKVISKEISPLKLLSARVVGA